MQAQFSEGPEFAAIADALAEIRNKRSIKRLLKAREGDKMPAEHAQAQALRANNLALGVSEVAGMDGRCVARIFTEEDGGIGKR